MSYSDESYARLKLLMDKIGCEIPRLSVKETELTAVADGCEFVMDKLEKVFSELWTDTMSLYGQKMLCSLFGRRSFDGDEIKADMSAVFEEYQKDDMKNAFKEYNEYCSVYCSQGVMTVSSYADGNRDSLYKMYPFFEKYLCPGVTAEIDNCSYTFDNFDGFDFEADKWDKIGACTFNFADSLGGE